MSQKDSKVGDASELEVCSDVCDFWDSLVDRRIDHIGKAPSPQQYSSATTPNIKALDEEQRILEDAMEVIRFRYTMEHLASEDALKALRGHFGREEHTVVRSITTIRRHHNLLVPVMRLPPEILSRIFVFHAQMEPSWLNGALTSTHVCTRWWETGRACPDLWSHINYEDCRSAKQMAWMIRRSGAVPLSLAINDQAKMGTSRMTVVSNNLHRFKSLGLCIPSEGAHSFFEVFSQSIPLLQRLTISDRGYSTFAFPPEFLGGSAPNLRHMKLTVSSYIPWDSGLFSILTTLEVHGRSGKEPNDAGPPSLDLLLSALARMPELEIVILHHCFPPPMLTTTLHTDVNLPNLKRLEVVAPLTRCTDFLRQMSINANAIVLLNIKCSSILRGEVEEFFTVFPSHLYTTYPPVAQALKFTWGDYHDFKIDIWTVQQDTKSKRSQNARIKLIFNWDWANTRGIRPLDLAWASFVALASLQLRSFRISSKCIAGWDAEVWRKLALIVPGLQTLAPGRLVQCAELCKALSPANGSAAADCCFPALSYLELEAPYDYPIPTLDGEESLSVVLARSLAIRALIGCSTPLLAFVISWESPPEGWSNPFRDAVPGIRVRVGRRVGEGFMG